VRCSATSRSGSPASRKTASNTDQSLTRGAWRSRRSWLGLLVLVLLLVAADQATKAVAQAYLDRPLLQDPVVIPGVLSLSYHRNPGGPFSWLARYRWSWVLGPLSVAATAAVVWWLVSSQVRSRLEAVACAVIVGGAVGNIIDRLWLGVVRDFLKLTCIRWPVFNLADTFICLGVGLLLLGLFRADSRAAHTPAPTSEERSAPPG